MTEQPQQPQQPSIPPVPLPRTDLTPPEGESDQEYQDYLAMLGQGTVGAWRDQDGTLYLERVPASMVPAGTFAAGPVVLAPDDPAYGQWVGVVEPEYDFMEPTPVEPQPRPQREMKKEAPDAQDADSHAEA